MFAVGLSTSAETLDSIKLYWKGGISSSPPYERAGVGVLGSRRVRSIFILQGNVVQLTTSSNSEIS
jgi:hypothetical protein